MDFYLATSVTATHYAAEVKQREYINANDRGI